MANKWPDRVVDNAPHHDLALRRRMNSLKLSDLWIHEHPIACIRRANIGTRGHLTSERAMLLESLKHWYRLAQLRIHGDLFGPLRKYLIRIMNVHSQSRKTTDWRWIHDIHFRPQVLEMRNHLKVVSLVISLCNFHIFKFGIIRSELRDYYVRLPLRQLRELRRLPIRPRIRSNRFRLFQHRSTNSAKVSDFAATWVVTLE
mmetsp:Transcript_16129/g.34177  ORF Transcript_16129/g.34177 Transcript_16129/m.34177 type:complete len:201 (+) Transcript_16129:86-688(+)